MVLTVYDSKDWIGDFLEPAVKIEKSGKPGIFYTDPEKAGKYSVLRINKETILSGFTGHTIQDIGINVKSQSETLQFKSWFGDSKVVDESGKALVVYHGTNWDGWEFDTENGAFFSEKEDYAEEMAAQRGGSRTVKAYLSIRNPLEVKVPGNKMADPAFEARIIAEAKSKGHDGVKLETDTDNEIAKDVFWVAFEPNQIKSATDNVGTFDPGNPDVRFSVAPDEELELDRVNQAFNNELQKQINGELPKGYLYQLGRPGSILRSTGIPDLPIEMSSTRLAKKAETAHHPFNIEDMKDLPLYLNKPIGVFEYGNKDKAQNIVVEIQKEDKHFIVGLSLNFKHDGLVVNSIRGLYPKDTHEWLTWIQKNKSLYLNKEKIQAQIDQQRRNPADVNYLDLDLISKIVRDFQNTSGEFENSSRNSVSPEADAELELVRGNSNSESGMRDAKLEQTGEAIRFIYEGDRAIPIAEGFQFDKTRDMQESMKEHIPALRDSGKHFVIREDQVDVRFNQDSGDEFSNSTYTQKLCNYKSKLFKAKAKCVAAVGIIIENARNGRKENATEGHSKAAKSKKFGRYDIEFALPSGEKDTKIYTGELVVLLGKEGKTGTFYDITNIKYDRKAGNPLIRETPTGALPEEEGQLRTHLPVSSNLPSSAENASEGTGKTSEKINDGTDEYGDGNSRLSVAPEADAELELVRGGSEMAGKKQIPASYLQNSGSLARGSNLGPINIPEAAARQYLESNVYGIDKKFKEK